MKRIVLLAFASFAFYSLTAQTFGWGKTLETNLDTYAKEIKSDSIGNIYALYTYTDSVFINGQAYSSHSANKNRFRNAALLVKYNNTGTVQWVRNIWSSETGNTPNFAQGQTTVNYMEVDKSGNVYLQGSSVGFTYVDTLTMYHGFAGYSNPIEKKYAFLAKLDAAGNGIWTKRFNSGYHGYATTVMGFGISPDETKLYSFAHNDTMSIDYLYDDIGGNFMLEFNATTGALLQDHAYNQSGLSIAAPAVKLIASNASVYFSFRTYGLNPVTVIAAFNRNNLSSVSTRSINGRLGDLEIFKDTLYFSGINSGDEVFLSKYHYLTSQTIWTKKSNAFMSWGSANPAEIIDFDINENGEILLNGFAKFGSNFTFDNVPFGITAFETQFTAKLDAQGNYLWHNKASFIRDNYPLATLFLDSTAYITGNFNVFSANRDSAVFGNTVLNPRENNVGGYDAYLVQIKVNASLNAEINLPDTVTLCQGDSLTLAGIVTGGSGTYTYRWLNGKFTLSDSTAAQPTAFPYQDTTYYFTVSDGINTAIDSVRINMSNSFPLFAFFFPKDSAAGYAFVPGFGPTDADSVFWDFGDGTTSTDYWPYHVYANQGVYVVSLYLSNFCGASIFIDTVDASCPGTDAVFNYSFGAIPNEIVFSNQSSTPTAFINTQWDFGDGNTSTTVNPTHTYAALGTYNVYLTITDSCGTDSAFQQVVITALNTKEQALTGLNIFPNPVLNQINIQLQNAQPFGYKLMSNTGQIILENKNALGEVQVDLNHLPAGIYFLQVKSGNKVQVKKLIKL